MPATLVPKKPRFDTMADVVRHLGGIPIRRILWHPIPGTATEKDVVAHVDGDNKRLVELVDGILVEKAMGFGESLLASYLLGILEPFVRVRNLGVVLGPDGMVRLFRGQIRLPDVCFIAWDTLPDGRLPTTAIAPVTPDLVVEVLSPGNRRGEMKRKRRDYFKAGGKLFWEVDPRKRIVRVFTGVEEPTLLAEGDTLDGGAVLPGFRLKLRDLFGQLDRRKST